MGIRFGLFLILALECVWAQKVYWAEQFPKRVRAGQPVKLRYRVDGLVTRMVFQPDGGGAARDLTPAGANLFDLDVTAPPNEARRLFQRALGGISMFNGATQVPGNLGVIVAYADGLPPVKITPVAADAQKSDYIFNLHAPSFFNNLISSNGAVVLEREPHVRRMYQLLGDEYDFVNVVNGTLGLIENRFHGTVRNSVQGIGTPFIDTGASFGSASRLIGFTMFPNANIFDGADGGYVHEQGHQWVNGSRGIFQDRGAHWPISSMATGIMGWTDPTAYQGLQFPCQFTLQGDGQVRVTGSNAPLVFTDFDLYLMGLLEPGQVKDQYMVTDAAKIQAASTSSCGGVGLLSAGQFRTIRVNDLIEANGGARVPSVANAPKNYRAVHLVLSRDGLLSAEEMAYFELMARRAEERGLVPFNSGRAGGFSHPWYSATGGRGTLTTRLVGATAALPVIGFGGVVNAGSFRGSELGPGAVGTIFGSNLANTTAAAASVPLPTTLGGLRVMVNGKAAPLFYASPTQVNFQIPEDLPTTAVYPADGVHLGAVHVERDGVASNQAWIELRPAAPGIITYGDGQAVATTAAGAVIGPGNPARPGQVITVYWVGSAPLSETLVAGEAAPSDRLVRVTGSGVAVSVAGQPQGIQFLGATPGGVGLFQANVALNIQLADGEHPLVLTVGGRTSNPAKLVVRR